LAYHAGVLVHGDWLHIPAGYQLPATKKWAKDPMWYRLRLGAPEKTRKETKVAVV
jgi:hypothetical protein